MATRWQYSLKAILLIVAVLSMPLAMAVSGIPLLIGLGVFSAFPLVGGSIGYVIRGWDGARKGVDIGSMIIIVLMAAGLFLLVTSY